MLTVKISDGLGNQLFQIFTAMASAFDFKTKFIIENVSTISGTRQVLYWDTILSNLKLFIRDPLPAANIIREQTYHYTSLHQLPLQYHPSNTQKNHDCLKLVGYFQSYKYFHHQIGTILKFLKLDAKRQQLVAKMENVNNAVSMHFRLGDYKTLQEYHVILPVAYYLNALEAVAVQSHKRNWLVYYFCEADDADLVNPMIEQLQLAFPNMVFTKVSDTYADWEQVLIMSACKHNIIANSTFSWWGAYLNVVLNNPNCDPNNMTIPSSESDRSYPIVCYPNRWFGPKFKHKKVDDLFFNWWTKVLCENACE